MMIRMRIRMRIRQEAWMRSRLLRKRLGKERVRPSPLPDACEEAREAGAKIRARQYRNHILFRASRE